MYPVTTSGKKEARINVKISPALRNEFHIAARLRGSTASNLIHQFIVKTIREEKLTDPDAFTPDAINAVLRDQFLDDVETQSLIDHENAGSARGKERSEAALDDASAELEKGKQSRRKRA